MCVYVDRLCQSQMGGRATHRGRVREHKGRNMHLSMEKILATKKEMYSASQGMDHNFCHVEPPCFRPRLKS